MAKVKQNKIADSGRKAESNKVKEGRVTKAPEPVKAKNIELASKKQAKEGKTEKSSKKSKKAPTPPPESSESESDASSASEGDSDASDESEAEISSKPVTVVKAAVNGASKILNGVKAAATKSEETSSEGSEGSESESDSENETVTAKPNGVKASAVANDSASESDSESDEEDVAAAVNGKKDVSSDDESDEGSDSDEDSDDSSASSDVEMGDNKKSAAPNTATKRKADTVDEPAAKKAKTAEPSAAPNAVKNLFVGNLSWNIDEDWLRREFEEFGTVVGCRIVTDRDSGRSKGFGYVDFEDPASASKALEAKKGTDLDGRPLNVDFSEPRQDRAANANPRDRANARSQQFGDATNPPSDTLFIANLSFDATAEVLKENFEEYGTITRVSLPTHPDSGQMKGFGYIGFSSIEEAQAAFDAWKGESLLGRPIRVDFSTPRPDNGGFGGGRGGGGRGGGGFRGGRGGGFDRGGRGGGGRGGGRGRGAPRGGGRGGSTNRGGLGDFSGKKMTF